MEGCPHFNGIMTSNLQYQQNWLHNNDLIYHFFNNLSAFGYNAYHCSISLLMENLFLLKSSSFLPSCIHFFHFNDTYSLGPYGTTKF
jgi:hypothetical protein